MLSRSAAGIRGSSLVMAQLIVCFAYLSYRDGLFVCEIRFFFFTSKIILLVNAGRNYKYKISR
jgi:hypothetical protein